MSDKMETVAEQQLTSLATRFSLRSELLLGLFNMSRLSMLIVITQSTCPLASSLYLTIFSLLMKSIQTA